MSSANRQEDQVVRNDTTERRQSSTPTADVTAGVRARSFAGIDLDINDKTAEREVLARADADFDRIFGSD